VHSTPKKDNNCHFKSFFCILKCAPLKLDVIIKFLLIKYFLRHLNSERYFHDHSITIFFLSAKVFDTPRMNTSISTICMPCAYYVKHTSHMLYTSSCHTHSLLNYTKKGISVTPHCSHCVAAAIKKLAEAELKC
jgi:hypothetical protein